MDATDSGRDDRSLTGARPFEVLVATSRTAIQTLFADLARQSHGSVRIVDVALDSHAVTRAPDAWGAADVAVVDASVDPAEAIAVCAAIHAISAEMPIGAVFCCPHSATAANLRGLLNAGVGSLVDLQLSSAEILRVLRGAARGHGAFHLQLAAGSGASLFELLANGDRATNLSDHDIGLLRLVALGLTDHEIGRQLYLSHHTVKHRIDRLRRRVHARNRVQLAAWAAGHEALRTDRGGPGERAGRDGRPDAPAVR